MPSLVFAAHLLERALRRYTRRRRCIYLYIRWCGAIIFIHHVGTLKRHISVEIIVLIQTHIYTICGWYTFILYCGAFIHVFIYFILLNTFFVRAIETGTEFIHTYKGYIKLLIIYIKKFSSVHFTFLFICIRHNIAPHFDSAFYYY